MKLIVAGGRTVHLLPVEIAVLDALRPVITEIVSGGAAGIDTDGEHWAKSSGVPVKQFVAKWQELGRKAGPIRNGEMASYADAVMLLPGGSGTENMKRAAEKRGLLIIDLREIGEMLRQGSEIASVGPNGPTEESEKPSQRKHDTLPRPR